MLITRRRFSPPSVSWLAHEDQYQCLYVPVSVVVSDFLSLPTAPHVSLPDVKIKLLSLTQIQCLCVDEGLTIDLASDIRAPFSLPRPRRGRRTGDEIKIKCFSADLVKKGRDPKLLSIRERSIAARCAAAKF